MRYQETPEATVFPKLTGPEPGSQAVIGSEVEGQCGLEALWTLSDNQRGVPEFVLLHSSRILVFLRKGDLQ